jgi:hypothetical protein
MKTWTKHLIPNAGTLVIVGLLFLAQAAGAIPNVAPAEPLAQAQPLISYQGTLMDQSGMPINGTVTMEFSFYDAESDGNLIWGPEIQRVEIDNGLFHVLLGSVEPILSSALIGNIYLQITVNDETLLPREALVSNVADQLVVSGDQTAMLEGNLKVGDNSWTPEYAGMDGNDMAVHGTLEQRGSGGTRVYKLGVGVDPGSGEGTLTMGNVLDMNNHSIIDAYRMSNQGNDILPAGGADPSIRLLSTNSALIFIDSDNNADGNSFRVYRNSTYVGGSVEEVFQLKENGNIVAHGQLNMNGNPVINCGAMTEANLQTAEEISTGRIDRFEEGDVLCWSDGRLEKCFQTGDPLVQAVADPDGRPIVIGAEAIKVVGPVKEGDFLVASDVPGYAMAAKSPAFGTVIAQALEDSDGEQGVIKAMIRKF